MRKCDETNKWELGESIVPECFFCIFVINGHSDGDFNVVIELSSKSPGECTFGGRSNIKDMYFVTRPILCYSQRAVKSL